MADNNDINNIEPDQLKPRKTGKGKKKIEIKPVENKKTRQVTFSKRRVGLFRKCDKLCSESGAQAAVITVSGAGRFFTHGNPNLDLVLQRYIDENRGSSSLMKNNEFGYWWDRVKIDDLGLDELERFKAALKGLRARIDEVNAGSASLSSSTNRDFGSEIDYYVHIVLDGRVPDVAVGLRK